MANTTGDSPERVRTQLGSLRQGMGEAGREVDEHTNFIIYLYMVTVQEVMSSQVPEDKIPQLECANPVLG
jgi:hypothetical protein